MLRLYVTFEDVFKVWLVLLAESDAFETSRVVRRGGEMAFDLVGKSHLDGAGKLIVNWIMFILTPLQVHVEEGIFR